MIKVEVCSACWKAGADIDNEAFLKELTSLQQELIEWPVRVERMGCQRFCPPNKITVSIDGRMGMAPAASREAVRDLILKSCLKNK